MKRLTNDELIKLEQEVLKRKDSLPHIKQKYLDTAKRVMKTHAATFKRLAKK